MQCYCEYVNIELCEYRMVATLTKNETVKPSSAKIIWALNSTQFLEV